MITHGVICGKRQFLRIKQYILESHQTGLFFHVVLKFNLLQQAAGLGAQYDSDWKIGFSPVPREELWFKWALGRLEAASTYGVKDAEAGKHLPGRSWITRSSAILERRSRSDEELMTMALEVSEAKNMTCRGHL